MGGHRQRPGGQSALLQVLDEGSIDRRTVANGPRLVHRSNLDLADNAYLLETGRVVLSGTSDDMKRNDAVRRAYLGE